MMPLDILDRLLGHDAWTTRQILLRCQELSDDQLDQLIEIDHGSVRASLEHMIGNIEVWTDLIAERRPDLSRRDASIRSLIERSDRAYAEFAAVARQVRDEGRIDDTFIDTLDRPPVEKPLGGAIVHVITHNMNHRAHVLAMLAQLGLPDLLEGDALSWEMQQQAQVNAIG